MSEENSTQNESKLKRNPEDCKHWRLYQEKKDTWNKWAEDMLSDQERNMLEKKLEDCLQLRKLLILKT